MHVALQSYHAQQEQGGTRLPTVVAKAKLLQDLVWHGTTTCAFVFQHGILVAVDSRASMGTSVGGRKLGGGLLCRVAPLVSLHVMPTHSQETTLARAPPKRCCP